MLRSLARRFGRRNSTDRRGRPATKARPHLGVEALEDRWVPATFQVIDGVLTYTAGAGVANNLTVSFSNGSYTFTDTAETISVLGVAGASGSGTKSVTFPGSQVPPGGIAINLGDLNDRLTIESSAHAIAVKGGDGHDTIDVGKAVGGNLGLIQAPVSVDGEAGTDSLRLNDQQSNVLASYTVTADKVTRFIVPVLDVTYAGMEYLTINAGIFADTFNVRSTAANTRTTLLGGENNDTFNVGSTANTLDDIKGTLTLNGGPQSPFGVGDQVVFMDQGSSARTYTFRVDNFLARTGSAMIGYSDVEQMTLNAGNFNDSVAVVGTSFGMPITLNMGGGDDRVTLGTSISSLDTFAPSTPVTVNGEAGTDTITLYDQVDDNGNSYVVTATQVTRNVNQMILNYATAESLTLNAGNFNDSVSVQSTNAATPVTLKMGDGGDTVEVGYDEIGAGKLLNGVLGGLTVDGQGHSDWLILDDRGSAMLGYDYTVTATTVSRNGIASVAYAGIDALRLYAASQPILYFADPSAVPGSNNILVKSTSASTSIYGAEFGKDYFTVGSDGQSLDTIQHTLSLDGRYGNDSLVLNDQGDANANNYEISSIYMSRPGAGYIFYSFLDAVVGSGGLTLNAGAFDDTVLVREAGYMPMTLNMGAGNDVVQLGKDGSAPSPLYFFFSTVSVNGQAGADAIVVNNADPGVTTVPGSTYTITSTDVTLAIPTLTPVKLLTYDTAESLAVNAGSGNDTIIVNDSRAETPVVVQAGTGNDTLGVGWYNNAQLAGAVTLDGQGGADWLDYWWYSEDVRVNLALGTATRVAGGISNIENVHGGWGNDIIVGNDVANDLHGGPGRDILIGRGGADQLVGESGDDILIGGSTVHDLIPARLEDLMREWSRTDLEGGAPAQYQARVYHLQGVSGGLNGATLLDLSKVIDDGAADYLDGGADLDWFFQFGADTIAALENWEYVN